MLRSAALAVTTNASFKNRRRTILSTYRNLFALRNLFVHPWRTDQDNFVRASACLHHPGKPVQRRARQALWRGPEPELRLLTPDAIQEAMLSQ